MFYYPSAKEQIADNSANGVMEKMGTQVFACRHLNRYLKVAPLAAVQHFVQSLDFENASQTIVCIVVEVGAGIVRVQLITKKMI
jgi:hypothetical protein